MSVHQKPNLWRVLSDTSRIISSNPLHFLALSLLFIFPIFLFNIISTLTAHPSPVNSHYRGFLSAVSNQNSNSEIPSFNKSQILYALISLLFNLCATSSITHSIFHGFHSRPIKFSSSLKSILSSFFPLLATKIAYFIIMTAITIPFTICMGLAFLGLTLLGFEIEASSKSFMAVVFVFTILLLAMFFYLEVKWFLMDAIVVVESKYGFAPFERSSNLVVKGTRRVAFLMILSFSIVNAILSWYSALAASGGGRVSGGVVVQMVVCGGFSTALSLFSSAASTVFFIYCKAFNGEFEVQSVDKLGQVYVQLPLDVAEHV